MKKFVGIGFGAIQSGLFLQEAHRSGNFDSLTVAEVDDSVVRAIRANGGSYAVNVAGPSSITAHVVGGVRVLNPRDAADRAELVRAIAAADEMAVALPSVSFYGTGGAAAPVSCLAEGISRRDPGHGAVIYTAENHNHAAEILESGIRAVLAGGSMPAGVQFLNTVIGKMSGVIADEAERMRLGLTNMAPGIARAVLVEEFNRILISRIRLPGFKRGITVFEEKDDLLPFEEAKLYGHNAIHALLGYLAHERGCRSMAEAGRDPALMRIARQAFLDESGAGLLHRYKGMDPLFTPAGFQAYAEDLLVRMTNPFLSDPVERVIRDPRRKLGWDDRLVGAMRLALQAGVTPVCLAEGVRAALAVAQTVDLRTLWPAAAWQDGEAERIAALVGATAKN